jgi:hypothetical protein
MGAGWIQRASDNFNRADEDPLSGGGAWSNLSPLAGMKIVSNQLITPPTISTYYGSYNNSFPNFPPNQYCAYTHQNTGLLDPTSRAVRTNPGLAGFHGYIGQVAYSSLTDYRIQTWVNGTMINDTPFAGRPNRQTYLTQRLIAVGNRIGIEYLFGGSWSEHSFIIDNNIPTGWPGIVGYHVAATNYPIDDWSAGDDGVPALGSPTVPCTGTGEYFGQNQSIYYWGAGAFFDVVFPKKVVRLYMGQYDANAGGSYANKLAGVVQYEILSATQIRLSFQFQYKAASSWNHGVQFATGVGGTGNLSSAWDVPIGPPSEVKQYYRTGYTQILLDGPVDEYGLKRHRRRHWGGELWDIVPEVAPYLG